MLLLFVAVPVFHQKVADDPVVISLISSAGWMTLRLCVLYLVFRGDEHRFDVP